MLIAWSGNDISKMVVEEFQVLLPQQKQQFEQLLMKKNTFPRANNCRLVGAQK